MILILDVSSLISWASLQIWEGSPLLPIGASHWTLDFAVNVDKSSGQGISQLRQEIKLNLFGSENMFTIMRASLKDFLNKILLNTSKDTLI